jgi:hypothetical protein
MANNPEIIANNPGEKIRRKSGKIHEKSDQDFP